MNYLTAPAWIARLAQRWLLERVRLGRLLRQRGVDPGTYLRTFTVVEVEAQLARCYSCPRKTRCDRVLRWGAPGRPGYSFCPNSAVVDRSLRRT